MGKHSNWMRSRLRAGAQPSVAQVEGRKLMGQLMDGLKQSGNQQGRMQRVLPDGTVVVAKMDGTTPTVEVHGTRLERDVRTEQETAAVWEPKGFVLYPVSDVSALGWGVPIIPVDDEDVGPYDAANRAPGLDVERWTPGGPLGQVVLSRRPKAGYPRRGLTSPMLFHPTVGFRPTARVGGDATDWAAYRLELAAYSAQSPSGSDPAAEVFKRGVFERTNAQRADVGRQSLLLPIRGFYDSAQATTECMAAAQIVGHYSECFPVTYRAAEDRLAKDGITTTTALYSMTPAQHDDRNASLSGGENLTGSPGGPVEMIGTDPNGIGIYRMPPGPPFSAQHAFDLWMSSTEHRDNIESVLYDPKGFSHQSATSLLVGYTTAYYAQHFIVREQWIATGNCLWHSAHAEIPALSWWSFNALNLAWETWPIRITFNAEAFTVVIGAGRDFTVDVGGTQQAALVYTDHAEAGQDRRSRPALSHRLFCRGRCIGVAPRGGLVLGAGVQKLPRLTDDPQAYRLIVLVHHADDQGDTPLVDGMTRALRVWFVDLPDPMGFAANPQTIIRGVYGEEDEAWPWITKNSPYSWRGGVLVNVSDGGTLLKYASLWRFNPDGTKAVCLRDFGDVADLEDEFLRGVGGRPGDGAFLPVIDEDHFPGGQLGTFTGGRRIKYLELDLADAAAPVLTVSAENRGARAHAMTPEFNTAVAGGFNAVAWLRPAAVDYDAQGNLIFAHHVIACYPGAYFTEGVDPTTNVNNARHGVHFGAWDGTYGEVVESVRWYSTVMALPGEDLMAPLASILDVRGKVFAICGTACAGTDTGRSPLSGPSDAEYPKWVQPGADTLYRTFDFSAACLSCDQVPASHTVRLVRDGVVVMEREIPNADALVHDWRLFPNCNPRFLPWVTNPALTATYAADRDGAWCASLIYLPQAGQTYRFAASETPPTACYAPDDNRCFNACGQAWLLNTNAFYTTVDHAKDGGGGVACSFASPSELIDLMQIPGGNVRSLYARVV